MKSKKKLLLMGVGVMGALAMGVGATSTFAWFVAAGASGNIGESTYTDGTMTVTNTTATAGNVQVPLLVKVIDNTPTTTQLALAKYKAQTGNANDNLVSGYLDAGNNYHEVAGDPASLAAVFALSTGKNAFAISSSLDITVEVNFGVIAGASTAGWAGKAGTNTYHATDHPYSYSELPEFWQTNTGEQYSASAILSSLATKYVRVGIKQNGTTQGRLYEQYAVNDSYEYALVSSENQKISNNADALKDYYEAEDSIQLSDIATRAAIVKDDLKYYVLGTEDGYSGTEPAGHTKHSNDVTAVYKAIIEDVTPAS